MLGVDATRCAAQYVTSVYTTTPLGERANAVDDAIKRVEGVSTLWKSNQGHGRRVGRDAGGFQRIPAKCG